MNQSDQKFERIVKHVGNLTLLSALAVGVYLETKPMSQEDYKAESAMDKEYCDKQEDENNTKDVCEYLKDKRIAATQQEKP